jgi:hypothetical protein
MPGEKGNALPFQGADDECVGRIAEGSFDSDFAGLREAAHGVETAAADDADFGFEGFVPGSDAFCGSWVGHGSSSELFV